MFFLTSLWIATLLTEIGDSGSSPHVAHEVFSNDIPWINIANILIIQRHTPEGFAEVCGEEAVDDRVGRTIKGGQGLYEGCHGAVGGRLGDVAEHLQQVEHKVGRPAHDEHCKRGK